MAMRLKEKLRKRNPRGAVDEVVGTLSEETVERLAIQPGQTAASLMADGSRRFPAPWRTDKIAGGYVVRDANGQALAYVYSRQDPTEAAQAKTLTADEGTRNAPV
jgi:hypothetical protein